MYQRSITPYIEKYALKRNKMAFISGPRQCGKTTLAKRFTSNPQNYFSWDTAVFKKQWTVSPQKVAEFLLAQKNPLMILDEFHKNPKWKNQLKGFYDQYADLIKIIVTGSAHLNVYRKGADSLMGRFFHFHLGPLSLSEVLEVTPWDFSQMRERIEDFDLPKADASKKAAFEAQEVFFNLSGFPEPFVAQEQAIYNIWSQNRMNLLIREDIPDTSALLRTHQVDILATLLPERVGSPLSIQSLREDLDVAHTTVSRWLNSLALVYYHFSILPFTQKINRSLKKDAKVYLYDWAQIDSHGFRFENMVAVHLLKMVHFYNDTGQAQLSLHYLKNKEGQEVDFILCDKGRPLLSIEVKMSEINLDHTYKKLLKNYHIPHFQIVRTNDIYRHYKNDNAAVISFNRFFNYLP